MHEVESSIAFLSFSVQASRKFPLERGHAWLENGVASTVFDHHQQYLGIFIRLRAKIRATEIPQNTGRTGTGQWDELKNLPRPSTSQMSVSQYRERVGTARGLCQVPRQQQYFSSFFICNVVHLDQLIIFIIFHRMQKRYTHKNFQSNK